VWNIRMGGTQWSLVWNNMGGITRWYIAHRHVIMEEAWRNHKQIIAAVQVTYLRRFIALLPSWNNGLREVSFHRTGGGIRRTRHIMSFHTKNGCGMLTSYATFMGEVATSAMTSVPYYDLIMAPQNICPSYTMQAISHVYLAHICLLR